MNTIIVTGVQIYPTKLLAKLGGFFLFSLTTVRLSVAYGCNPTRIYLSKNWAIFKINEFHNSRVPSYDCISCHWKLSK